MDEVYLVETFDTVLFALADMLSYNFYRKISQKQKERMKTMFFDYLKKGTETVPRKAYDMEEVHNPVVHELERVNMEIDLSGITGSKKIMSHVNSQSIPISCIRPNPRQPRLEMDKEALNELAASIENYGLMQPITVRQTIPFEYELVAGHRRLEACRMLGMDYIPATIIKVTNTDSAVMALVENIQRENLSYIEEAEAFQTLLNEHGLTQEELAAKLGKSQSTIANKVRILRLPVNVRAVLCEYGLTERHARALLKLNTEEQQMAALEKITKNELNVARTEELIERMLHKAKALPAPKEKQPAHLPKTFKDIRIFSNTIRKAVDLMNKSGVGATAKRREADGYIEYLIKIPKG